MSIGIVFANCPGDLGSKTQEMVLDASLLNTQYYKVWIKESGAIQGKE